MFIKLSYTATVPCSVPFRILSDIINTSSITSISALVARAASVPYASDLTATLDTTNSYIIRTDDPVNTTAYISRPTAASGNYAYNLMIRQQVYDTPGTYYYTNLYTNSTTTSTITHQVGTGITGGTMSDTPWLMSSATTQTAAQGSNLSINGTTFTATSLYASTNKATYYIYITDTCFMFTQDGITGVGPFSDTNLTNNTFLFSAQYKRLDYWNTSSNGIIPVVANNRRALFSTNLDYANILNGFSATATECPLRMLNYVDNRLTTNTSWSVGTEIQVVPGLGTRYADVYALAGSAGIGGAANSALYGAVTYTTNYFRMLSSDLTNRGYTMYPLSFRNMYYCVMGGNITEKSKFYVYVGDYSNGDEIVYNNKTYAIWSTGAGSPSTTRFGLAIPKE